MAKFANMAYCPPRNSRVNCFAKHGIIVGLFLTKSDLRIERADYWRVIVYFRGPNISLEEWKKRDSALIKYDIAETLQLYRPSNTRNQRFKSFFVDRVWYEHVQTILTEGKLFENIERLVRSARNRGSISKDIDIRFIGHGVGGAYATLAGALYMLEEKKFYTENSNLGLTPPFPDRTRIYTFGQPRVGDKLFAWFLNQYIPISRVTHTNDYVSQFPVGTIEERKYFHSNVEYWISHDSCDCHNKNLNYYQLIECNVDNSPGENPHCNSGQRYTEGSLANEGPYFGVKMGECNKGMEDIFSLPNWIN
ncbi:hypothetical protein G9A89_007557 [Geosiphon pyriformis]|nr:hypothetical protein G9A89_007557 [Geosiphon pyriformis]